jgi:hypothetical protein
MFFFRNKLNTISFTDAISFRKAVIDVLDSARYCWSWAFRSRISSCASLNFIYIAVVGSEAEGGGEIISFGFGLLPMNKFSPRLSSFTFRKLMLGPLG